MDTITKNNCNLGLFYTLIRLSAVFCRSMSPRDVFIFRRITNSYLRHLISWIIINLYLFMHTQFTTHFRTSLYIFSLKNVLIEQKIKIEQSTFQTFRVRDVKICCRLKRVYLTENTAKVRILGFLVIFSTLQRIIFLLPGLQELNGYKLEE